MCRKNGQQWVKDTGKFLSWLHSQMRRVVNEFRINPKSLEKLGHTEYLSAEPLRNTCSY